MAAAFFTLLGIGAAVQAVEMGYGSARFPGPGFLPFWLSALLAGASLIYLFSQLGADAERQPLWKPKSWVRPLLSAVVMLAFSLLMGWLGLFSATCLLFVTWLVLIERERWTVVVATAVLGTGCAYVLFGVLLKVPLPHGLFF
jgi:putative tricarboxylic transport membrane protein